MKIAGSSVALKGSHTSVSQRTSEMRLTLWGAVPKGALTKTGGGEGAYKAELGIRRPAQQGPSISRMAASGRKPKSAKESYSDARLRLIEELMFLLTGKRLRVKDPADSMEPGSQGGAIPPQGAPAASAGYGLIFESTETYFEAESVQFSASGSVQTEDGRSISFDLRLAMERSYYESHSLQIRLGDAARTMDPLAINLGGAFGLTNAKFAFDLDGDGNAENISFLTGQAGFLSLDRNGDGKIGDGTELFGTKSGNGFKDLAVYDEDGNGWIDENDSVFKELKIFNMNADGSATLLSLGAAGVGALYLGAIDTQYSFKNGAELQGEMKKSSVFLKENGQAGSLHHIDLSI